MGDKMPSPQKRVIENEMQGLKQLYEYQAKFDKRHGWFWNVKNDEELLKHLQYLGIALAGEVGEFCNLIKKVSRSYSSLGKISSEKIDELKEELVDIFIYLIKGASQLFKIDLVDEYYKKMKKNEEKFQNFEQ